LRIFKGLDLFKLGFLNLGCLTLVAVLYTALPFTAELGLSGASVAAAEREEPKQKTRRVPSMSESTFKKLAEAQELIDLKDFQGSLKVLNDMLASRRRKLNGNEVGQVHNMLGFLYFSMEDYPNAIRMYKVVVDQGDEVPEGLEVTTLYTLAQLSFVADRYQDALDYMETWISKANNPGPDPHIFMGQVYYQMEDYPKSIIQIELGISVAKERGTTIKENWWALLNYLYWETENMPKVLEILEILVRDFPKRDYWIRLAGIHGQEGHEREQVASMEAAHVAGFLTRERDLTNLAGLLMQAEVPVRAAWVLDTGVEQGLIEKTATNLRSLGQAWQLAQETKKAIPVFEAAAKLSDDGRIYERLAQLYLDNDEFPKCVRTAGRALDKGGLRKKQTTYVVRGMCEYNQDNLTPARRSFVSCRNESRRVDDDSNRRICQQWITFIDRESIRRQQLRDAI
jgi:tetratricopeptide (TPR) repeat protein